MRIYILIRIIQRYIEIIRKILKFFFNFIHCFINTFYFFITYIIRIDLFIIWIITHTYQLILGSKLMFIITFRIFIWLVRVGYERIT